MDAAVPDGPIQRGHLLIAAALVCAGVLVSLVAGILHPEGTDPNAHAEVFATYAANALWTTVHLGQFAGAVRVIHDKFELSKEAVLREVHPATVTDQIRALRADER